MNMFGLFTEHEYETMRAEKYIRVNQHPELPLYILNYTEKTQYDNVWNDVTKQCRGLIVDSIGNVIARPFDKFMNYGQNQSDIFLMDYRVEVTDKMDGSLGILWNYKGHQGIATRGSFVSDQAIHATKIWNEKYGFKVADCWTYLFEIVYPGNRIVLDYGDLDDLVLLGVRDIMDGSVLAPNDVPTWRGPRTATFPFASLSEALTAPPRDNAEGFVVYFPDLDYRIKIKQDDYIALHKIVTGLTERRVWENMKEGKTLQDLCEIVPDEWHDWLSKVHKEIQKQYRLSDNVIRGDYRQLVKQLDIAGEWDRKEFARLVNSGEWSEYPGFMFMLLDGKDIGDKVWDLIKPTLE